MFSFFDIRRKTQTFVLLHTRANTQHKVRGITIDDIDQMLSADFQDELRIVRRMLTGSAPKPEAQSEAT